MEYTAQELLDIEAAMDDRANQRFIADYDGWMEDYDDSLTLACIGIAARHMLRTLYREVWETTPYQSRLHQ